MAGVLEGPGTPCVIYLNVNKGESFMEPNRFGTSREMVIDEIEVNGIRQVMAIDEKGLYLTTPDKVARPTADVNRYGVDRSRVIDTLESMGYDTQKLRNENHHIVAALAVSGSTEKKLNPIKASKRGG
ncbi:hypothetical protein [Desulfoluna sp.]|uniref:hypothetical protein n=1 Tax=Desulfoluna sp. TaxID=2045199 RepID=UPI00263A2EEB|nr:hypothetical protein [Desulfoluna sp.]